MSQFASTDRVRTTYKPESTFGVPVTASACYAMRNSGNTIQDTPTYIQSNELTDTRTLKDNTLVDMDTAGAIPFDFSYGEYDWWLSALLQNNWTVYGTNGVGANFAATFGNNTITAGTVPTSTSAFTNLVRGQWIKVSGSSINGTNIWVQVSKTVSPTSTVITTEGNPFTGVTGSGGSSVNISGARLTNGVIQKQASVEKANLDVGLFMLSTGVTPNTFSLNLSLGQVITGSFDCMGKNSVESNATALNSTITSSLNYRVMNPTSNLASVLEGGATAGTMMSLALSYNNNNRAQKALGQFGVIDMGQGQIALTLTGQMYFKDYALYTKMRNSADTEFSFRLQDPALNGYVFTIPAGNITSYGAPVSGKNQDVMVDFEITAKDNGAGIMLIIDRAGAAVTLPT